MTARASSLEQRKQRWTDAMDAKKPPRHVYMISYEDPAWPKEAAPWPNPDRIGERIERAWREYSCQLERLSWLNDDTIPHLWVRTGTEIFAEAFGCRVHRPADNNPFALALVRTAAEAARIKVPRLEDTPLMQLFDMADELKRRGGKDAVLGMVDIQTPMDISALIWNKADFFMAMVDEPDAVKELSGKVKILFEAFFDEWFRRYGPDFIGHCCQGYMAKGISVSEDEIGSVNGDMFLEFFLPELVELSNRYGGLGMHCCANAKHQWEHLIKIPDFRVLNICQPSGILKQAYKFFAPYVLQWHGGFEGAPETWPSQCPPNARAVLNPGVKTADEARVLADTMWTACGRN